MQSTQDHTDDRIYLANSGPKMGHILFMMSLWLRDNDDEGDDDSSGYNDANGDASTIDSP